MNNLLCIYERTARLTARLLAAASLVAFALALTPFARANGVFTSCDGAMLQQAVNMGGLVTFACVGTITLTSPIEISKNTTISGTGHTISGDTKVGVIAVPAGVTLNLDHLNIIGGNANLEGGGVFNRGTVNISHCTFSNNAATSGNPRAGGGISNHGTLTVANTLFTNNTAFSGGAIYNIGHATVNSTTFQSNSASAGLIEDVVTYGGAIFNDGRPMNGIPATPKPTLTITNSRFLSNFSSTGAAVENMLGTVNIITSTLSSNNGAGVVQNDGGTLSVMSSTLSDNEIGIISNNQGASSASNTIVNSTISGNGLAGINQVGGSSNVNYTTLFANDINYLQQGGNGKFSGTVLALGGKSNCAVLANDLLVTDLGYNLSDDSTCMFSSVNHSFNNATAGLLALADNGGPTKTIAPDPASLIIDKIPAGQIGCGTTVTTDQRGVRRPQGKGCEIGAYEVAPSLVPPSDSCNGYFTGQFIGNLLIGGTSCVWVGGSISGTLRVTGGGHLFLIGATVGGNVEVTDGSVYIGLDSHVIGDVDIHDLPFTSAGNQVCGANIDGNLEFQNNGAGISIGDDPLSVCAGNNIGGNLVIQNNAAPVMSLDNTILGDLNVHNNSAPVQIIGNTVTGSLKCQNDSSVTGGPNPGSEKAGGECYQIPPLNFSLGDQALSSLKRLP